MAERRYELVIDLTYMVGGGDKYIIVASPTGNTIRIYKHQLTQKDCSNSFMLGTLMTLDDDKLIEMFDTCKYMATREEMVELLAVSRRKTICN